MTTMKNFIIKILFLFSLIFLTVTLFLFNAKMFYHTGEYPMWKSKLEYIENIHKVENIIIGDSRAVAGFDPRIIEDDFYNLSIGGGTPIEGYFILKRYLVNKNVNKLIISYSPMHLEFNKVFFARTLKYDFLSQDDLNEVFLKSKELDEKFFRLKNFNNNSNKYLNEVDYYKNYFKAILTKYNFLYFYIPEIQNSLLFTRYINNHEIYLEIKKRKGNYDFGTETEAKGENFESTRKTTFSISKIMNYYLNEMLLLCEQHNIKVYFMVAPFNKDSYIKIKEQNINYIIDYESYIKSLEAKYINVRWNADIFYYENEYFGDPSHLNRRGQTKFSIFVKRHLQNNQ